MARLIIPYKPREVFRGYHSRTERFAVGVAHRRCGKTVAVVNDMIKFALLSGRPNHRAAYVAPYLKQAKDVAWDYLKRFARPLLARPPHESELWVELLNGARIRIYGADNADALRGGYLDDVTLDEYADMGADVWGSVIRPMLSDRKGRATFIGTPKGRDGFCDLYEAAKDNPEWFRFFLPASVSGVLDQEELDGARRDMTPEQYAREYECDFDAAVPGAYYAQEIAEAERAGRVCDVPRDPMFPVYTAWDLGIGDSTAIWAFQVIGAEVRVIDHIEAHGHALPHYVGDLVSRGYGGPDYVPHDARARELGTGLTRVETLQRLGREPRIIPNHSVQDGINAARVVLGKTWFDKTRCKAGLNALRLYRADYDDAKRTFADRPIHDWTSHTADAFRYLAMAYRDMTPKVPEKPKPTELAFEADEFGRVIPNMTVRDFVEAKMRKKRENAL